jgi:hypothetical protein
VRLCWFVRRQCLGITVFGFRTPPISQNSEQNRLFRAPDVFSSPDEKVTTVPISRVQKQPLSTTGPVTETASFDRRELSAREVRRQHRGLCRHYSASLYKNKGSQGTCVRMRQVKSLVGNVHKLTVLGKELYQLFVQWPYQTSKSLYPIITTTAFKEAAQHSVVRKERR